MQLRRGDRVRIRKPNSEYTGCRGTIADEPGDPGPGVVVLGHQVAIDGENGVTRPFLLADLEPLQAARVRGTASAARRQDADGQAD
ncbi:MAG: hypothetical protein H6748_03055 [Spirochaetaceae bacterium]|nr:hypothetical protein [Spirochaetaceae bacterium]HPG28950.1 hypothetical protein [Myxococcota bacterium]